MKNLAQSDKMVNTFIARAHRGDFYLNLKSDVFRYLSITIILARKKYLLYLFHTFLEFIKKTSYPCVYPVE